MIVVQTLNYSGSKYGDSEFDIRRVDDDFKSIFTCLQGRVRFGNGNTGSNGENIDGKFLTITTNGTADTESTFTHNMGSVPVGYIILWQDKAGSIYQGPTTGTSWTNNTISLKGSAISITAKLFLLQ